MTERKAAIPLEDANNKLSESYTSSLSPGQDKQPLVYTNLQYFGFKIKLTNLFVDAVFLTENMCPLNNSYN